MKKIAVFLIAFCLFILPCSAAKDNDIYALIPEEAAEQFEDAGVNAEDPQDLLQALSFENIVSSLLKNVKRSVPDLSKFIAVILGYVFAFAVLDKFSLGEKQSTAKFVVRGIIHAVLIIFLLDRFSRGLTLVTGSLDTIRVFCESSVPMITALLIEGGKNFSAAVFSYAVSIASALLTGASFEVFLPLLRIYVSVGSCSFLWDMIDLSAVTDLIRRAIKWMVGALFFGFSFTISVQNILARSADSIAKKAIKTAAAAVPMFGAALSEGIDGVFTLAGGTRTAVAGAGIAVILAIFAGPAVHIALQSAALYISYSFSRLFGQKECLSVLRVMSEAYKLLLGIFLISILMSVVCFLVICMGAS